MPEDDSDDKIRRNLVGFSAAVVAMTWLDIPMSGVINRLIEAKLDTGDSSSLLTLGIATLFYFALRYRFSTQGSDLGLKFDSEMKIKQFALILRLIERQLDAFTSRGTEPSVFGGEVSNYLTLLVRHGASHVGRPKVKFTLQSPGQADFWVQDATMTFMWSQDGSTSSDSGKVMKMHVDDFHRRLIGVQSFVSMLFYSATSITYLVPVGLTVAATAILSFRLTASLLR